MILTLLFFHCYTNENNSDFSFRIISLPSPLFFVAIFFLNTTGIPLVLLKKGNFIFIEITVDIFLFQSIGWCAQYLIDVIND